MMCFIRGVQPHPERASVEAGFHFSQAEAKDQLIKQVDSNEVPV